MCLAVPGRVTKIEQRDGTRMAKVDFGGVVKDVCLEYLPELEVGDWAIVHVGFALQRLDEESARRTLELFAATGDLDQEFGDAWGRAAAEAGAPSPAGTGAPGSAPGRPGRTASGGPVRHVAGHGGAGDPRHPGSGRPAREAPDGREAGR